MISGVDLIIEVYHASKYGNGARVSEELQRLMTARGNEVNLHHIDDARPKELPPADLYVFGSPTRLGKPIGSMRRFLKKVTLPPGTKYAVFATHGAPVPDKKTGKIPPQEELERWMKTIPMMDERLQEKGMVKVGEMKFFVVTTNGIKGNLEEGWQNKVETFVGQILGPSGT